MLWVAYDGVQCIEYILAKLLHSLYASVEQRNMRHATRIHIPFLHPVRFFHRGAELNAASNHLSHDSIFFLHVPTGGGAVGSSDITSLSILLVQCTCSEHYSPCFYPYGTILSHFQRTLLNFSVTSWINHWGVRFNLESQLFNTFPFT